MRRERHWQKFIAEAVVDIDRRYHPRQLVLVSSMTISAGPKLGRNWKERQSLRGGEHTVRYQMGLLLMDTLDEWNTRRWPRPRAHQSHTVGHLVVARHGQILRGNVQELCSVVVGTASRGMNSWKCLMRQLNLASSPVRLVGPNDARIVAATFSSGAQTVVAVGNATVAPDFTLCRW